MFWNQQDFNLLKLDSLHRPYLDLLQLIFVSLFSSPYTYSFHIISFDYHLVYIHLLQLLNPLSHFILLLTVYQSLPSQLVYVPLFSSYSVFMALCEFIWHFHFLLFFGSLFPFLLNIQS